MIFVDSFFSREDRYSIGIETASGRHYLSIPVSSRILDYEEYYEITPQQHRAFDEDRAEALRFAEACRRRDTTIYSSRSKAGPWDAGLAMTYYETLRRGCTVPNRLSHSPPPIPGGK